MATTDQLDALAARLTAHADRHDAATWESDEMRAGWHVGAEQAYRRAAAELRALAAGSDVGSEGLDGDPVEEEVIEDPDFEDEP